MDINNRNNKTINDRNEYQKQNESESSDTFQTPIFVRLIQLLYADMQISGEVKRTKKKRWLTVKKMTVQDSIVLKNMLKIIKMELRNTNAGETVERRKILKNKKRITTNLGDSTTEESVAQGCKGRKAMIATREKTYSIIQYYSHNQVCQKLDNTAQIKP